MTIYPSIQSTYVCSPYRSRWTDLPIVCMRLSGATSRRHHAAQTKYTACDSFFIFSYFLLLFLLLRCFFLLLPVSFVRVFVHFLPFSLADPYGSPVSARNPTRDLQPTSAQSLVKLLFIFGFHPDSMDQVDCRDSL